LIPLTPVAIGPCYALSTLPRRRLRSAGMPRAQDPAADLGKSRPMCPSAQRREPPRPAEPIARPQAPLPATQRMLWRDESDCAAFATALAAKPGLRDACVELRGSLGAGKTTFVRHLLRALGVEGRIRSPSFTVLEPYAVGGLEIAHLDCYRFASPREWIDAGLRDVFAQPGLKLVEWPEKAEGALPLPDLRVCIEVLDESAREVTLQALTPRGLALLG
jgi:tRNA threonylcarbamoyladenosine biosynthesis protein TsaE